MFVKAEMFSDASISGRHHEPAEGAVRVSAADEASADEGCIHCFFIEFGHHVEVRDDLVGGEYVNTFTERLGRGEAVEIRVEDFGCGIDVGCGIIVLCHCFRIYRGYGG